MAVDDRWESDACLLERCLSRDETAVAALRRRHDGSARRLANILTASPGDASAAVSAAFDDLLRTVEGGATLGAVRPAVLDRVRRSAVTGIPPNEEVDRTVLDGFFELTASYQAALWHRDVEDDLEEPGAAAQFVGVPGRDLTMVYRRASAAFRANMVRRHLETETDDTCRSVVQQVDRYLDGRVNRSAERKVGAHLQRCDRCHELFGQVADVPTTLQRCLAPAVLGTGIGAIETPRQRSDAAAVGAAAALVVGAAGAALMGGSADLAGAPSQLAYAPEPSSSEADAAPHQPADRASSASSGEPSGGEPEVSLDSLDLPAPSASGHPDSVGANGRSSVDGVFRPDPAGSDPTDVDSADVGPVGVGPVGVGPVGVDPVGVGGDASHGTESVTVPRTPSVESPQGQPVEIAPPSGPPAPSQSAAAASANGAAPESIRDASAARIPAESASSRPGVAPTGGLDALPPASVEQLAPTAGSTDPVDDSLPHRPDAITAPEPIPSGPDLGPSAENPSPSGPAAEIDHGVSGDAPSTARPLEPDQSGPAEAGPATEGDLGTGALEPATDHVPTQEGADSASKDPHAGVAPERTTAATTVDEESSLDGKASAATADRPVRVGPELASSVEIVPVAPLVAAHGAAVRVSFRGALDELVELAVSIPHGGAIGEVAVVEPGWSCGRDGSGVVCRPDPLAHTGADVMTFTLDVPAPATSVAVKTVIRSVDASAVTTVDLAVAPQVSLVSLLSSVAPATSVTSGGKLGEPVELTPPVGERVWAGIYWQPAVSANVPRHLQLLDRQGRAHRVSIEPARVGVLEGGGTAVYFLGNLTDLLTVTDEGSVVVEADEEGAWAIVQVSAPMGLGSPSVRLVDGLVHVDASVDLVQPDAETKSAVSG